MSHLAPCPACSRHLSTGEDVCPFCSIALPEAFRRQPGPVLPRGRLGRAAMAAAAAALMGAGACSGTLGTDASVDDGPTSDANGGAGGAGGTTGGGGTTGTGGSSGAGGSVPSIDARPPFDAIPFDAIPIYGAAPPPDSGFPESTEP